MQIRSLTITRHQRCFVVCLQRSLSLWNLFADLQSKWPKATSGPRVPAHQKNPLFHKPNGSDKLFIYSFSPHSTCLFFVFLGSIKSVLRFLLFVISSICLISCHACWQAALQVKWLLYDCKGFGGGRGGGVLLETCLPSPVGYLSSAVSSWRYCEGFGVRRGEEKRGEGRA